MIERLQIQTDPEAAANDMLLLRLISDKLALDANRIRRFRIVKRSIDARQRKIKINLTVVVAIDRDESFLPLAETELFPHLPDDAQQAIIVGAGPAGLFAALRLIQLGIKPLILERGKDVDSRRKDVAAIARTGVVDSDSNYCFGEGGAGTFSDGKLFTRSKKRGDTGRILGILHSHGADEAILIDAHPHIGTDRLPVIIKAIRQTIIDAGGEVKFGMKVSDIIVDKGEVVGVVAGEKDEKFFGPVILATGHSARDTYRMLLKHRIALSPKGIAVGVRLEHPQEMIDRLRYHTKNGRGKYLPPAEYTFLTRVDGRAVYSFCMCPGGIIVPAASAPGQIVVNGMSPSNRGSRWANSGMVVEILPEDVEGDENDPLKMMDFQEEIEKKFFGNAGGTQNAGAQRMTDFVSSRSSADLPATSYAPGVHPARVDLLLPRFVSDRLKKGFVVFNNKNRGFLTDRAIVIGDETRTSSPVRIERDGDSLASISHPGIFPCGEGAGYAGGIVSAAMDGEKVADAVANYLKKE